LSQTKVERIVQVLLVVGTTVKDDGESLGGVDTGSASVEGELSDLGN
jgi:hypothetical protein